MTPERLQQVEALYHAALARPHEQRAAFLAEACGDDEPLRLEVESLIASHEQSGEFIERPAFERGLQIIAGQNHSLIGREIGPYKVLSLIGAGGMGEVYIALDTRLGRKVAIKALNPSVSSDPESVRRFWHEARAASAIVHPGIVQIYEFREAEQDNLIVMEYVDGVTLRRALAAGPRPLIDCLDTACQVAASFVAAHQAGIIHRDIKPENIMLLADEHVKVLDFGLAKKIETLPADTHAPDSASSAFFKTAPGTIIGTLPYMSPEQVRGNKVDARTDLWSLGVVIYEMVTGRVPFSGDTPSDVIAAIIERTPQPLSKYNSNVPDELERVVGKALAKEAEKRYQTAQDLHADLKALKEELAFESKRQSVEHREAATATPYNAASERRLPRARNLSRWLWLALLAFAMMAACGVIVWKYLAPLPEHFLPGKTAMRNFSESGNVLEAAISSDGRFVVYVTDEGGQQRLWMKQVATADKIQLPQPEKGYYNGITISPDGNYIYYSLFRDAPQGELYRVSIPAAADSKKLMDDVDPPVALSPDGKRFAFVRDNFSKPNELVVADADTGNHSSLVTDSRLAPGGIAWSPRDEIIACCVRIEENGQDYRTVAGYSLKNGQPISITNHRWKRVDRIAWLEDMSGLVLVGADEGSMLAQVWHLSYPEGNAHRITTDISEYRTLSLTADSSTLATVQSVRTSKIWIAMLPGSAVPPTILSSGRDEGFYGVAWTLDGRLIYTSTAGGSRDLWIMNKDGSNQKRLTRDGRSDRNPLITPDGQQVLFVSDRDGTSKIWRINLDGTGLTALTNGPDDSFPTVSPDGRWVIYASRVANRKSLWKVSIEGGQPFRLTSYLSNWPAVSPDGKYIACLYRDDPGTSEIKLAIIPFAGDNPVRIFGLPPGIARPPELISPGFRWSQDGLSVFYVNTSDGASNIWSQPINGGMPRQITSFTSDRIFWFDFARNDNTLAYARGNYSHDVVLINDQNAPHPK